MIIVLEGCDASGKSTLSRVLADRLHWPVIPSEGPPKWPGEMNERVERYSEMDNVIFDRHPCVSQPIYGGIISRARDTIDHKWIQQFNAKLPFFVLCRPNNRGFDAHVANEGEDPEHLKSVAEKYNRLCEAYDNWGLQNAQIIYNIGQRFDETVALIVEHVRSQPWYRS